MTEATRLPQLGTTETWITDPSGNVVNLHGVNLVSKTNKTPEQLGFDDRNAKFLAMHGFSVVRLGVGWCNVQPNPTGGYDDNYLASLARTIELLAQFNIYTLVDFHQDAYGAPWGFGAPAWAVAAGGSPTPHYGFPICTFGGDQLNFLGIHKVQTDCDYALDAFWNNNSVSGAPLWNHYLRMQQHVVAVLKDQGGNIFGYDVMNEPTPGSYWVDAYGGEGLDMSRGCRTFDTTKLQPFYEYVLPILRGTHPEAILWFEPNVLHGLGSPTFLPGFKVANIGFNFHNYDPGDKDAKPPISGYQRPVENALSYQKQTGLPMITSEFGGEVPLKTPEEYATLMHTIQGIQDGAGLSYMFWTYFNNPTYPFFGHPDPRKQGIVEDMSKPLLFPNVQEIKLKAITRVYPRIVSGTPTSFSFDPDRKTFHLEYKPILPSGQRGKSPTQIVVPAPLYLKDPVCRVTGGTSTRTSTGFDILAAPASTTVTVDIGP
jgi:endoglycosylceramidase